MISAGKETTEESAMIAVRSAEDAAQPRAQVIPQEGLITWVTRYFGREVEDLYASAHLVEQQANTVGGAHYHACDQFQVIVDGAGLIGKRPVGRYSVHFARAFSPYGPLRAGGSGLTWFTLRNGEDPGGIKWMPASREQLRTAGQRPQVVYGDPEIPPQPDGLAAWRVVLGPGERRTAEPPSGGKGQYWLIFAGSGKLAGHDFQKDSLLFVAPSEPAVTIEAGPAGIDAVGVQFPSTRRDR